MKKQTRATKQIADLMGTAPIVVAQRVSRFAGSGSRPTPANRREAGRMVQEKMAASAESMLGMTMTAMRVNARFSAFFMRPWFLSSGASTRKATSFGTLVQEAAADLSSSAVAPLLRRAKANAKRLSR